MRILITDDEFNNRKLLQAILTPYGECDIAVDGQEAVDAFLLALSENNGYDLICLDVMMPKMSGQEALEAIREHEKKIGIPQKDEVKIIMTTALGSPKDVFNAFYKGGCTSYIVKPIDKNKLLDIIKEFGLL